MATLYLASGLFNAAERLHNLFLEKYLKALGHEVILPQREAKEFFDDQRDDKRFDINKIAEECRKRCLNPENIYVGNIDGPDADSGTCVEYGVAVTATGRVIVYRTDLRTAEDKEVGVNAMLKLRGTVFIYFPCFFTELDQVEPYYRALAQKIHEALFMIYNSQLIESSAGENQ